MNGPQLYCRIWYFVFLQIAVSYYFTEFYTSGTKTWINNRPQIPPSSKTEESFFVMCQFCWIQKTDKDFMSRFPLSILHFSVFWCNLDIANPLSVWPQAEKYFSLQMATGSLFIFWSVTDQNWILNTYWHTTLKRKRVLKSGKSAWA